MEDRQNGDPEGGKPAEGREGNSGIPVSDRRFWAGEGAEGSHRKPPRRSAYPSYVEELQAGVETLQAKLAEKEGEVLEVRQAHARAREEQRARIQRLERDQEQSTDRAVGDTVEGLLDVLDNLDLALDAGKQTADLGALLEGVGMARGAFLQTLQRLGLEQVATVGAPFDPEVAEAVSLREVEDPDQHGVVVEEARAGYIFRGGVLRPAKVIVGRHPDTEAEQKEAGTPPPEESDPDPLGNLGTPVVPEESDPDSLDDRGTPVDSEEETRPGEGGPVGPETVEDSGPGESEAEEARYGPAVSPADIDFEEGSERPDDHEDPDWEHD